MKRVFSGAMVAILFSTIVILTTNSKVAEVITSDDYPVHNLDTGLNYTTIQEAIDAPETLDGHTIFVDVGIYYENLVINKSISLTGENASNTIIDGMGKGDVVHVDVDDVVLSKFTIINSKNQGGYAGINSRNTANCSINENSILTNWRGIWLYHCSNYVIQCNNIANTTESLAIWLEGSNGTVISSNIISNNPSGVYLYYSDSNLVCRNRITDNNYYGLTLTECSMNLIIENVIENNSEWDGIALWSSCRNTVTANNISSNPHGLLFGFSSNNTIYHNNFINNTIQAYDTYRDYDSEPSINSWNNDYASEGNYWSNYTGVDLNHDGIGDTPHVADGNNTDNYPLMGMFNSFNTSPGKNVNVISNSTINDFEYFEQNSTIRMHVSNMTENQTHGFIRMSIPHALMAGTYDVTIDGAIPTYWNYTLYDNGTHRWIYFEYEHSELEIVIVLEFPLATVLPLTMVATLLAIVFRKSRTKRQSS